MKTYLALIAAITAIVIYFGVFYLDSKKDPSELIPPARLLVVDKILPYNGPESYRGKPIAPYKPKWPSDEEKHEELLEELSDETRKIITESPVPVLLPSIPKPVSSTRIFHWGYENPGLDILITYQDIPISIYIIGAGEGGRVWEGPTPLYPHSLRGLPGIVNPMEGGWGAAWNEFGVIYYLQIHCFRAHNDPRCQSDQYIRSIVENLKYVGGKGES